MIPSARRPAPSQIGAAGLVAILLFATIGQLSHHGQTTWTGYAEDTLPFLGCWLALAWTTGRFLPTWLLGCAGGVLIRAVVLSRLRFDELSFLAVALVFIGLIAFVALLAIRKVLG